MTDTNGLIRAAGGPRPKDDLVERLLKPSGTSWIDAERGHAAAELTRLRDDLAQSKQEQATNALLLIGRAEKAEAERDTIRKINNGWAMDAAKLEEERDALRADAERLQAMAAEWNRNRRNVGYEGMPIWDALCEAIGDDADGEKMRAAIDTAREKP